MSIFYEQELQPQKVKRTYRRRNINKPKVERGIMKARYNNSGKYKAMIITIPKFVIQQMGLKHGDRLKVTISDDSIIIKPFIGENEKK